MSSKPNYIEMRSELGEQVAELQLGYFAVIASAAMRRMTEDECETTREIASDATRSIIETFNAIDDPLYRYAIMSQFVLNCAASLHMTLEHEIVLREIEEEFGESRCE